jgi:Icc-related predicted phosphoesterase
MIYVTGDMHGDINRFKKGKIKKLNKGDTLIVCGDFGFIWDNSKKENKILNFISKKKFTTAFIDGAHENFELINSFPEEQWNNATIRRIRKNIIYLKRGQIFNIENHSVFTFGGGTSVDFEFRNEASFLNSLPGINECKDAVKRLIDNDISVDFIITHQPPGKIRSLFSDVEIQKNHLHNFFDELMTNGKYKKWFFGSIHQDRVITPTLLSIFENVVSVEEKGKKKK